MIAPLQTTHYTVLVITVTTTTTATTEMTTHDDYSVDIEPAATPDQPKQQFDTPTVAVTSMNDHVNACSKVCLESQPLI